LGSSHTGDKDVVDGNGQEEGWRYIEALLRDLTSAKNHQCRSALYLRPRHIYVVAIIRQVTYVLLSRSPSVSKKLEETCYPKRPFKTCLNAPDGKITKAKPGYRSNAFILSFQIRE
jgi:hypothetical protein